MIFWLVAGLLTAVCVALLLRPLARAMTGEEARSARADQALALYRDQLDEVAQDLEEGVIGEAEAAAAKREIERRMLRADAERAQPPSRLAGRVAGPRRAKAAAFVLVLVFPLAGAGLYLLLGSPDQPGLPYAERADERRALSQASSEIERLRQATNEDPRDLRSWVALGRGLAAAQRFGEAAAAYRQALALGADEQLRAALGEALTLAADGNVTPEARQAFELALQDDPRNPRARYYLGLALSQEGRLDDAMEVWMDLAAESTPDAPWRPALARAIRTLAGEMGRDPESVEIPGGDGVAAGGPSQQDVEAAGEMTAEERDAMIRSMVERLAQRLAEDPENPENFDDWLRLAQSYAVLGEREKAAEALAAVEKIVEKLPADDPRRQAFEEAMGRSSGE